MGKIKESKGKDVKPSASMKPKQSGRHKGGVLTKKILSTNKKA